MARQVFEGGRLLAQNEVLEVSLDLPAAGDYRVALVYEQTDYPTFGNSGEIRVNDKTAALTLGGVWYDLYKERQLDRYGNETISNSAFATGKITQFLSGDTDYDRVDSVYPFQQGSQFHPPDVLRDAGDRVRDSGRQGGLVQRPFENR